MINHTFAVAFDPKTVLGGAAGIRTREAVHFGVARGPFSNEAGMSSTPHAHATADVDHLIQQGMAASVDMSINTILVCTTTTLIILLTDADKLGLQETAITQRTLMVAFDGLDSQLLTIYLIFFVFTAITGWYYFGESNIRLLFCGRHLGIYRTLVLAATALNMLGKMGLVWGLPDMFNGFMVIPSLIALFLLRREIHTVCTDYLAWKKTDIGLSYQYEFHEPYDNQ